MKTKAIVIVLALLAFGCGKYGTGSSNNNDDTICLNYQEPISKLPVAVIHDMVDGYRDNQLEAINQQLQIDDAKSNWFSLEDLKKFIYHIESKATADNALSADQLGIRIYYASYPANLTEYHKKALQEKNIEGKAIEQYPRLHTVIMIPTRKEGDLHVDFDPDNRQTFKTRLNKLKYYRDSKPGSNRFRRMGPSPKHMFDDDEPMMSALNHGSLFPPLNDDGEAFN